MRVNKFVTFISVALFSSTAFAMFCPTNYNEINIGDSLEQVLAQCGKPTNTKSRDDTAQMPHEWTYYTQQSPSDPTSLRLTVAFDKGVVTNMTVNNVGIASTQICKGNLISVGETEDQIKQACGDPGFVKEGNNPSGKVDITKVTELTYQGTPNVVLTFEDGKLKSRK